MQLSGYRRPGGRVGFRNHVLILPTAICSASVAQKIAGLVPGVTWASNTTGCCLLGEDIDIYRRALVNTAGHPNVAATLVIGLGCEAISAAMAAEEIAKFGKPVRHLEIQSDGGVNATIEKGVAYARDLSLMPRRLKNRSLPFPTSSLVLSAAAQTPLPASPPTRRWDSPATGSSTRAARRYLERRTSGLAPR